MKWISIAIFFLLLFFTDEFLINIFVVFAVSFSIYLLFSMRETKKKQEEKIENCLKEISKLNVELNNMKNYNLKEANKEIIKDTTSSITEEISSEVIKETISESTVSEKEITEKVIKETIGESPVLAEKITEEVIRETVIDSSILTVESSIQDETKESHFVEKTISKELKIDEVSAINQEQLPVQEEKETFIEKPSISRSFASKIREWFLENSILKAGIVILFIGVALLLKFTAKYIHVSISNRYLLAAFIGLAFLGMGLYLRNKSRQYALNIQGAGIAIMYLTALSAVRWHPLISPTLSFAFLVTLTILLCVLAIYQNAKIMAQISIVGALAAPILVSTGSNNYIALFTYLSLLNSGVAAIVWYKAWRSLNSIAFTGCVFIVGLWGRTYYKPSLFYNVEPFLIFNILLFTVIALFMARQALLLREHSEENDLEGRPLADLFNNFLEQWMKVKVFDSSLIFGTAIIGFSLQYMLVQHIKDGAAYSAFAFALYYGILALLIRKKPKIKIIFNGFVLLALIFFTLSIPLMLNAKFTVVAWILESGLIYIFSTKQRHPLLRAASIVMFSVASIRYLFLIRIGIDTLITIDLFAHSMIIIIPALMIYYRDRKGLNWTNWELNGIRICVALETLALFLLPMGLFNEWSYICSAWLILAFILYVLNLFQKLILLNIPAFIFYAAAIFVHVFNIRLNGTTILSMNIFPHILIFVTGALVYSFEKFIRKSLLNNLEEIILETVFCTSCLSLITLPLGLFYEIGSVICLIVILFAFALYYNKFGHSSILFGIIADLLVAIMVISRYFYIAFSYSNIENWLILLLGVSTLYSAWIVYRKSGRYNRWISNSLVIIGLLIVTSSINYLWAVRLEELLRKDIWIVTIVILTWTILSSKIKWKDALRVGFVYLPLMLCLLIIEGHIPQILEINSYIYQEYFQWLLVIVIAFGVHFVIAYSVRNEENKFLLDILHMIGFTIFAIIIYLLVSIKLNDILPFNSIWRKVVWLMLPLSFIALNSILNVKKYWPVNAHKKVYQFFINAPICLLTLLSAIGLNFIEPKSQGFPYIPLINVQEIFILLTFYLVYLWVKSINETKYLSEYKKRIYINALTIISFFFITMSIARIYFFYFGIGWDMSSMFNSFGLQASWSIAWTISACVLMLLGSRKKDMNVWILGVILIAIVVVKLFLVELANTDSIERVVSFIIVGILLSGIAYIAPSPIQRKKK